PVRRTRSLLLETRVARPVAPRRAALRAGGEGDVDARRLLGPVPRQSSLYRQAAAVLLGDQRLRETPGGDRRVGGAAAVRRVHPPGAVPDRATRGLALRPAYGSAGGARVRHVAADPRASPLGLDRHDAEPARPVGQRPFLA